MTVLKSVGYGYREMATIKYNCNDIKEIKTRLKDRISEPTINKLLMYMYNNNKTLLIEDCGDAQSGWKGMYVTIDGVDLSVNGYSFNEPALVDFLKERKR